MARSNRQPSWKRTLCASPLLLLSLTATLTGVISACSGSTKKSNKNEATASGGASYEANVGSGGMEISSGGTSSGSESGTGGAQAGGAPGSGATATGGQSESDVGPVYLKASNTGAGDLFGVALAISGDGNTLAVGANREASGPSAETPDDNSILDSGAVYLYLRSGNIWQQQAFVKASNADEGDAFGSAVALSADGNTLAVGAIYEASGTQGVNGDQDDNSAPDAGAIYLFSRSGESWQQQAYIKASNTDEGDLFGFSIALSANGNTLAVGAEAEDGSARGINGDEENKTAPEAGAVYLFSREGNDWQQQAYIKASNTDAGDHFGGSVALSSDGSALAVGAYWEDSVSIGTEGDQDDNSAMSAGAAYVFQLDGETWSQNAYLKPSQNNVESHENFGSSLSLSADGKILAVGAAGEASSAKGIDGEQNDDSAPYAGAAYLFVKSNADWQQQAYLKASNTSAGDEFGRSVKLSDDGQRLAIGAALEASLGEENQNDDSTPGAGATYVFGSDDGSWRQERLVKAPNADVGDRFGWSIGLSSDGNTVAIGASRESGAAIGTNGDNTDNSAARSGAVYIFHGESLLEEPQ